MTPLEWLSTRAALTGAAWKELKSAGGPRFELLQSAATAEQTEYATAIETYKPPPGYVNGYKTFYEKHEDEPKRPLSGYIAFSNSVRGEIKALVGGGGRESATAVVKECGVRWRALGSHGQAPWNEGAAEKMAAFKVEMAAFKATLAAKEV